VTAQFPQQLLLVPFLRAPEVLCVWILVLKLIATHYNRASSGVGLCCKRGWAFKVFCLDASYDHIIHEIAGSEACPYHVCHPNMVRVLHRFFSAGCKVCARTHAGRRSLLTVPHAVPQGLRTLLQAACSVRRRLGLCTVCGCGTCPRVAWMVPSPSWELQSEPSSSKAALPASGPARHAP